ncbi:MAG: glycosyltransferase family 2 protein [bacterium]
MTANEQMHPPSGEESFSLSIVIPAYNEEEAIATTIGNCLKARDRICEQTPCESVEVILVSDGSFDRTEEIARGFEPEIRVFAFPENRGYGAAIKHGFEQAHGNLVAFLDGDSTCDPMSFIPQVNKLLATGADVCIGSRMGPDSEMPAIRRVGNWIFRTILNTLAGSKVSDTASGMRVIRRSSLRRLYPLPDGLHFTPAMSCRAIFDPELKIEEVFMVYRERVGRSKLSVVKDGLRFLHIISEIALTYQPLKFFGGVGAILLLLAMAYGIGPILHYLQYQKVPEDRIYRLLAVITFAVGGLMLTSVGLLANRVVAFIHGFYKPTGQSFLAGRFMVAAACCVAAGVLLNAKPLYQYITERQIHEHWSYVALGAVLVLSGMQVFCFAVLELILDKLWVAQQHRKTMAESIQFKSELESKE